MVMVSYGEAVRLRRLSVHTRASPNGLLVRLFCCAPLCHCQNWETEGFSHYKCSVSCSRVELDVWVPDAARFFKQPQSLSQCCQRSFAARITLCAGLPRLGTERRRLHVVALNGLTPMYLPPPDLGHAEARGRPAVP
ncbi:hypothetical protein EJ02DRAFT_122277 [Clathrospora elynae]|uniref:Uncharacterized protein n=1 Tax=Clathrospora elynae TaxID=706981 RepID=A0A6A5SVP1_9PLEO|nr:hypothetical protein EJ02DRAFT_122277 [Clathrospora elynae]